MILEKRLVLFALILYFPCSLCDDNALQEAANSIPHRKWNSDSMEKLKSNVRYDFTSAESSTSFANGSPFTDSLGTGVSYNPESVAVSYADDNSEFTKNPTSSTKVDSGFTETTTSVVNDFGSTGSSVSYNFESTRDLTRYASDDPRGSTRRPTSLASAESESAENHTGFTNNPGFTGSLGSGVSYNPESIENPTSVDPGSTRHPTSFASTDSEFTENLTTNTSYKSTVAEEFTTRYETDFTLDNDNNTDNSTICDPKWPVNASDIKEVINLKVENKSTEWIFLSWEIPCENETNVTIIYSVERYGGDNFCQTNETNMWHNATGLDPCTEYTFRVKVLTEFWESDGVSLTENTDNTISEIGNVLDLSVSNISVTTVQLAWRAPVVHAKCISNYAIAQCDENACSKATVVATNYTANDLNPCTEYNFTVKTVTLTVESTGSSETVKTATPKLSKPESIHIIPGNFSLNVTWEPPEFGANCIKYYLVSLDSDKSLICNTTNTNCSIEDLHACATHEVHVEAMNKDNVLGETAIKSGTTNPYKTSPPKPLLPIPPPHATNITIIWNIEKEENNNCQLSSIYTVCNHTEAKGSGYLPLDSLSSTNVADENVNKPIFTMNTTVSELSPYTSYICWGYIVSEKLQSDRSDEVNATTFEARPDPPTLSIKDNSNNNFSLIWEFPSYLPGTLEQCDIAINWEPCNSIPEWCASDEPKTIPINCNVSTLTYDFEVKPFTNYTVKMRAKTKAVEWSDYSEKNFSTKSAVPGAITRFNSTSISIKESPKNPNVLETILTWGMPCSLNGEFEYFKISIHGIRDGFPPHSFFKRDNCTNYVKHNHMCMIILEEDKVRLKGEFNYTFTISTKVKNVVTLGQETSQSIQYPPGMPPQPEDTYIDEITSETYAMQHKTTTTAVVFLPLFPNDNGNIKYYAIMVSEKGHNEPSSKRFDLDGKWPNASSWKEAMMKEFAITYQATRRRWDPYEEKHVVDYNGINVIKYEIGVDTYCKESLSTADQRLYCNGPLKPDMQYDVRIRAFTYGGYADSKVFPIKTNAELNIVFVIGAVFSIILMGILVTMMLIVRKCSPYILLRRLLHSDMPGSPVPAPFTRKKFINHCQELVDNPGKLSNEFRLLQTLSVDLQMPTNTACLQANRKKNRYSDILPYDFSRVKLEVIDNDPNTDYINASFIRGYSGEDEYIACQGPKEETTYDFWRMVDQYNINIIVMLTQLVEKGKEKCHQYYPAIRETFRYENMTIRCTSELDYRTHTQRTLVLQKENKKRNITHLHFKDWPDHDVPEDFDAMINFCQIMRRNISANNDFIVVHCSAGIGRTGTLIAIDILLQHLRDDRKLDVFGIVYRLRHNRINMVQRESQYAYIYNCIKQVLKNPYFSKTCKPPPVSPVYQNISKKAKEATNSDNNLVNNLEL